MIQATTREWLVIGMLALSPLAYVGSMAIENALPARSIAGGIGEAEAARIATEFASTRGVDTKGWEAVVGTETDEKLEVLFRKRRPAALEGIAAPSTIRVQLQTDNGNRWFRVTLTPSGKVIGFQESRPKDAGNIDEATAAAAAEAAMRERWGADPVLRLTLRDPSKKTRPAGSARTPGARTFPACATPRRRFASTSMGIA